jgi:nicotinate-nucleotide adenylyltransferase
MRIGLLGGSFDPPHNGHLLAAEDAMDALRLDCVIVIPAAIQPLKAEKQVLRSLRSHQDDGGGERSHQDDEVEKREHQDDGGAGRGLDDKRASPEHRLAMTRLLVDGVPGFAVDAIEIERGGLSYTVDTLSALASQLPSSELFWLIGADGLKTFAKWRSPEKIVELATVVVLRRTGETPDVSGLPGPPRLIETRRVDISSTEIRQRVREGRSIRGFVPDAVAHYIATARLYR